MGERRCGLGVVGGSWCVTLFYLFIFSPVGFWDRLVSWHKFTIGADSFAVYGVSVASSPCRLIKVKVIAYPSRILSKNPSTAGERLGIWSTALPAA